MHVEPSLRQQDNSGGTKNHQIVSRHQIFEELASEIIGGKKKFNQPQIDQSSNNYVCEKNEYLEVTACKPQAEDKSQNCT